MILREWFTRMMLDDGDMDNIVRETLIYGEKDERHEQFLSAYFEFPEASVRGDHEHVSTVRRMRCKLCDRRMKGRDVMHSHLVSVHNLQNEKWELEMQKNSIEAFSEFMLAATGLDAPGPGFRLKGGFTHPDGSR